MPRLNCSATDLENKVVGGGVFCLYLFLLFGCNTALIWFLLKSESEPLNEVGNVCSLQTAPAYTNACEIGFQSGLELVDALIANQTLNCSDKKFPYATFEQLVSGCKQFFGNDTLTSSCLSGQSEGFTTGLLLEAFRCAQHEAAFKDAALIGFLFILAMICLNKPIQQVSRITKNMAQTIWDSASHAIERIKKGESRSQTNEDTPLMPISNFP